MTNLIIRLFVKNRDDLKDFAVRENYGKVAGLVGVLSNILLFGAKFIMGTIFNSVSVVADAFNNLSDCVSSLITTISFKMSSKPADKEHPYGHARYEYLAGVFVAVLIILLGFSLIGESVDKIFNPQEFTVNFVLVASLLISVLIKFWQYLFYRKISKLINSKTLKASSLDSRNDAVITSGVLCSGLLFYFLEINIDAYLGLAISVFILISGVKLIIETISPLIGQAVDGELIANVKEKILSYEGVLGVHDLEIHNYGEGRYFASIHCEMDAKVDIMQSHEIIDNIEKEFKDKENIRLLIHLDPVITDDEAANRLKIQINSLIKAVYKNVTTHDFRVVWGKTHSNIIFDLEIPFDLKVKDEELRETITNMISSLDKTYIAVIEIDRV